jgi:integrase
MRWQAAEAARRRTLGIEVEDAPSKRLLSVEEVEGLLTAAQDSPIFPAILLQSKLGLLIAEALAVRKSDFDFSANVLRVRKQLKRVELQGQPSRLMLTDLKTAKARRDIPLPPSVAKWAHEQPEGVPFTRNEKDGWLEPRRAQELFSEAAKKAGLCGKPNLPDPTSHDLRFHWTSRLLNDLKVPVTVVSRLCGHANIETTLKHYSEATLANLADAMALLD